MAYQPPVTKAKEPMYPVVASGVTMQELPGEVAFFLEFGNCTQQCPGCHSPHLSEPTDTQVSLSALVDSTKDAKALGATAVLLMGGPHNGVSHIDLVMLAFRLSQVLPVGMYIGAPVYSQLGVTWLGSTILRWLKLGEYREDRGGLTSRTTNQLFLERINKVWQDRTYLFWRD